MKYDAFISYRHLEKDMYAAKKIHKMLESVRLPRNIKKETGKKRINRVFRDQDELPIGSDLGSKINQALMDSEYLIVICSPYTKNSRWVMQEINTFIAMHGRKNILAVLVEGEPEESFPPQLLIDDYGYPVEPLAADVRGENHGEMKRKIATETVRLAAAILGVDYDELRQRRREGKVKRNFAIAAACAVLGISFGAYNAYNVARINENYQQKLINESKVLSEKSLEVLEAGDRKTAALLAKEALPSEDNDRVFVPEAMYALSCALETYNNGSYLMCDRILTTDMYVEGSYTQFGGKYVVAYDAGENVYCFDCETGETLFKQSCRYVDGQKDDIRDAGINSEDVVCVLSKDYLTGYDLNGKVLYDINIGETAVIVDSSFGAKRECIAVYSINMSPHIKYYLTIYDSTTGEIIRRIELPDLYGFFKSIDFDTNNEYVAIDHGDLYSDPSPYVSIYDIKTGEEMVIETRADSIQNICFADEDCIITISKEYEEISSVVFTPTMYVQKFNFKTGEVLWEKELIYDVYGANKADYLIDGNLSVGDNGCIGVAGGRNLYVLDLKTGEQIGMYKAEDDIADFAIGSSFIGYVCTYSGSVDYVAFEYNIAHDQFKIGSNLDSMCFGIGDSYLTARSSDSPNIYVLKYPNNKDYKSIATLDDSPVGMLGSPDGTNYFVKCQESENYYKWVFVVFDSKEDKETGRFAVEVDGDYSVEPYSIYLDEDTILVTDRVSSLYYYHISTKELETVNYDLSNFIIKDQYALIIRETDYEIYDLLNRTVVVSGDIPEDICTHSTTRASDFSVDFKYIYVVNVDDELLMINTESGQGKQFCHEYNVYDIVTSSDNDLMALICLDGFVRIYKPETGKIVDEIEFSHNGNSYIAFSADNKMLICCGSDKHLKIYDINNNCLKFVSTDTFEDMTKVRYDEESGQMVFSSTKEMVIFDVNNLGIIARIKDGKFISDDGYIICGRPSGVFKMKQKNLDDLYADFYEQFGDAKLSEEQRLMFKID